MGLASGTRLGAYEIVAPIGAGGMGEVYRARDTRLRREVAIKVLPASVATDEERLRRFEQEALATAALNHPNILVVFDVGKEHDTAFVVEELLEGRTLREVMAEQSLPVRKVVEYGVQIANGLAAAHGKDVIHRDLKPENLFVTTDDRVKILDFGLAKIRDGAPGGASTRLAPMTEPGIVLGTIGYMSPEQVRGVSVDHRADIFSFGAILYELLGGRRAFGGDTAADTMSAILKEAPADLGESGRSIPPALARVVDRCLDKNPALRFQSASDLAFALHALGSDVRSGSTIAPAADQTPNRRPIRQAAIAAGLVLGGAVLGFGAWSLSAPAPAPSPMFVLDVAAPREYTTNLTSALSPDGSRLAFTSLDAAGNTQLWLRTLANDDVKAIAGTDEARNPFWSPNGSHIGYFGQGRLRTVDLDTGRVQVVCEVKGVRTAGTWNQQDVILFASEANVPIMRVPASGKDLESGEVTRLRAGKDAQYADGHLLFVVGEQLMAQPFDAVTRTLSGEPVPVTDVGQYQGDTGPNFSVSANGLIAIRRQEAPNRELVWFSRDGKRVGAVDDAGDWRNPELSPDDARLAAERNEGLGTGPDVWIVDVGKGTRRALSATRDAEQSPLWTATDRVMLQRTGVGEAGTRSIVSRSIDGTPESTTPLLNGAGGTWTGLTPDDQSIVLFTITSEANRDIVIAPRTGTGARVAFASTPFNEAQPALSPDGRWLAYVSDESGLDDVRNVFIQAFPAGGHKQHVSVDTGGVQPRWRDDGRELFYLARDGRLMVVSAETSGDTLRLGAPQALFQTTSTPEAGLGTRAFDVTRDGKRFIVSQPRPGSSSAMNPITVIVNWTAALARPPR